MSLNLRVLSTLGSTIGGANTKVILGSQTYCTKDVNGNWVISVAINQNMTDRDMQLVNGYIDHEAAHVRFTDMEEFRKAFSLGEQVRHFCNSIEDIRIEGLISQHYPGAALNLNRTATKLCEDDRFWAMPTPEMGLYSLVSCFVLYGGRYHYLKQLALAERCESAFGLLKQRVSTALFSEFANCFMQMRKVSSTQEALALAIAINDLLKQAVDEEQQKQEQEKEQENGGSGDGDADESGDAGDGDADESGDAGDGDADESGEAGDGEPDESGEAGDGEPDESGEAGDGEPDESGEAVQNGAGSSRGNDQDLWHDEVGNEIVPADICEGLAEKLQELFESTLVPGQEDPFTSALRMYRMISQVPCAYPVNIRAVQAVQLALNKWCLSFTNTKQTTQRSGSRLNTRQLAGVPAGNFRVFDRTQHARTPSAAVQVLLDASGSMTNMNNNRQIPQVMAGSACASLVKALQGLKSFAVSVMQFNESVALVHDWETRGSLGFLRSPVGGTETSGACYTAMSNLITRKEDTKILFILTDGDGDLSQVLPYAEQNGVTICAIRFGREFDVLTGLDPSLQPFCTDLNTLHEMFTAVLMKAMGRS